MDPEAVSSRIRVLICGYWQPLFRKDSSTWEQVICCFDAIEDTERAAKAYRRAKGTRSFGRHYLHIYGLLQALIVQQDALMQVTKCFGRPFNAHTDPCLADIRDIRNASIGHPTNRGQRVPNGPHFNAIVRISLRRESFELSVYDATGSREIKKIRVLDLIKGQRQVVARSLNSLADSFVDRIQQFKQEQAGEDLSRHFVAGQPIGEALGILRSLARGHSGGLLTETVAADARKGLAAVSAEMTARRFEDAEDAFPEFQEIRSLLRESTDSHPDRRPIQAVARDLIGKFRDLETICAEIDEYMSPDAPLDDW